MLEKILGGFLAAYFLGLTVYFWRLSKLRARRCREKAAVLCTRLGRPLKELRFVGTADTVPGFEFEHEGRRVVAYVKTADKTDQLYVMVPTTPLPRINFRKESALDRLGKLLLLNREARTGDEAFDREFYLDSDEPHEVIREALASPALRQRLRELPTQARVGFQREGVFDSMALTSPDGFEWTHVPAMVGPLVALADGLPDLSQRRFNDAQRMRGDRLGPGAWVAFLLAYVATSMMQFFRADFFEPIVRTHLGHIAGRVALVSLVAGFLWVRGNTHSLRNFALLLLPILFGIRMVSDVGAFTVNALLDTSPPHVYHTSLIAQREEAHYRSTTHWVSLGPPGSADARWTLIVSSSVYHSLHVGDPVRLVVRDGALGWRWIDSVSREP